MIRVVHIQTHLPSSGNAAFRLHNNMNKRGIYSTMLSLTSDLPNSEQITSLRFRAKLKAMLNTTLSNRYKKGLNDEYGMFSYPVIGNDLSNHDFGNVRGALPYTVFLNEDSTVLQAGLYGKTKQQWLDFTDRIF